MRENKNEDDNYGNATGEARLQLAEFNDVVFGGCRYGDELVGRDQRVDSVAGRDLLHSLRRLRSRLLRRSDTIDKDRVESAGVWMDDAEGFSFNELYC